MTKVQTSKLVFPYGNKRTYDHGYEQSIELNGDDRLAELVLCVWDRKSVKSEVGIEYKYSAENSDCSSTCKGVLEMVVGGSQFDQSIDSGVQGKESINGNLLESCERWRDIGNLLEHFLRQLERESLQMAKRFLVLERSDARHQTSSM